jgi:2-polyprenyl-3-methyl-5-hydroxy-6-metoxy-1,4-benzoquinol methylase
MDKHDVVYKEKTLDYFENVRTEILPLLPTYAINIFEVGCGAGDTLSFLKKAGRCEWAGGMEVFHDAAEIACGKLDFVIEGNVEELDWPLDENSLEVILCLDVLEHLLDPWEVIRRLHRFLKPGGMLICSIPNVRNFRVLLPLLFFGKWRYSNYGILDKTHLRFFTKESAIQLVECSGLEVDMVSSTGLEKWSKAAIANLFSLNIFRAFFEYQYLIRAIKK